MKWTQDLPKKDGYYWFCEHYEGIPLCLYFILEEDIVCTWGYYHNDPAYMSRDNEFWYSSEPVDALKWEEQ